MPALTAAGIPGIERQTNPAQTPPKIAPPKKYMMSLDSAGGGMVKYFQVKTSFDKGNNSTGVDTREVVIHSLPRQQKPIRPFLEDLLRH